MNPPEAGWLLKFWQGLDPLSTPGTFVHTAWAMISILAFVLFSGRFYIQWFYSERLGRSVVPVAFWYMSAVGALLYLAYNTHLRSPVGTLSYSFNIVVYARNLVHIWHHRGILTPRAKALFNVFVAIVTLIGAGLVVYTWTHQYKNVDPEDAARTWFWIAVGATGTALFACRFLVQWLASEARKRSVIPTAFWYLSIAAALLQTASYAQRSEWNNLAAVAVNLPIYLRNLWLIHRPGNRPAPIGE